MDADFGVKRYEGKGEDGTQQEKVKSWFGCKLQLVVHADYELPVAYEVTNASCAEAPVEHRLLEHLEDRHPEILAGCELVVGDKGLDDGKLIQCLRDAHEIKPVIDIRDMWRDGEETHLVSGTTNQVYDAKGGVFRHHLKE